ncbi:hypothetical protein cyc_02437 [Cyclospora cayetanensis]|uniref:Uncharacterized protein n=1 Tax=Cyclospora cayetanensis TaxID=88456 RepID=A0A1D3CYY8_9EIME|nr:hypothetical protein cyc_02437 [Cyclospora cayetanensis]
MDALSAATAAASLAGRTIRSNAFIAVLLKIDRIFWHSEIEPVGGLLLQQRQRFPACPPLLHGISPPSPRSHGRLSLQVTLFFPSRGTFLCDTQWRTAAAQIGTQDLRAQSSSSTMNRYGRPPPKNDDELLRHGKVSQAASDSYGPGCSRSNAYPSHQQEQKLQHEPQQKLQHEPQQKLQHEPQQVLQRYQASPKFGNSSRYERHTFNSNNTMGGGTACKRCHDASHANPYLPSHPSVLLHLKRCCEPCAAFLRGECSKAPSLCFSCHHPSHQQHQPPSEEPRETEKLEPQEEAQKQLQEEMLLLQHQEHEELQADDDEHWDLVSEGCAVYSAGSPGEDGQQQQQQAADVHLPEGEQCESGSNEGPRGKEYEQQQQQHAEYDYQQQEDEDEAIEQRQQEGQALEEQPSG